MQFATAASQTFKFYKMKKLSRDEMKKVMGGRAWLDDEECNAASVICTACTSDSQCPEGRVCRASVSCIELKVCARPYLC